MKQGSGNSRSGDTKPGVQVHAINPRAVAQIGSQIGNHVMDRGRILKGGIEDVHNGRGFVSPGPNSCATHKAGSQGRS